MDTGKKCIITITIYRNASNGTGDEYEFRFEGNSVVCVYFVSLILFSVGNFEKCVLCLHKKSLDAETRTVFLLTHSINIVYACGKYGAYCSCACVRVRVHACLWYVIWFYRICVYTVLITKRVRFAFSSLHFIFHSFFTNWRKHTNIKSEQQSERKTSAKTECAPNSPKKMTSGLFHFIWLFFKLNVVYA